MSKVIIDTDIYIDFLRSGLFDSFVRALYTFRRHDIFFSSVVIEELLQGVLDSKGKKYVEILFKPFEKVGRIVTPHHSDWKEAGNILSSIRKKYPHYGNKSKGLVNDALIAVSARRIGATLYSSNKKDFELLQKIKNFDFSLI